MPCSPPSERQPTSLPKARAGERTGHGFGIRVRHAGSRRSGPRISRASSWPARRQGEKYPCSLQTRSRRSVRACYSGRGSSSPTRCHNPHRSTRASNRPFQDLERPQIRIDRTVRYPGSGTGAKSVPSASLTSRIPHVRCLERRGYFGDGDRGHIGSHGRRGGSRGASSE